MMNAPIPITHIHSNISEYSRIALLLTTAEIKALINKLILTPDQIKQYFGNPTPDSNDSNYLMRHLQLPKFDDTYIFDIMLALLNFFPASASSSENSDEDRSTKPPEKTLAENFLTNCTEANFVSENMQNLSSNIALLSENIKPTIHKIFSLLIVHMIEEQKEIYEQQVALLKEHTKVHMLDLFYHLVDLNSDLQELLAYLEISDAFFTSITSLKTQITKSLSIGKLNNQLLDQRELLYQLSSRLAFHREHPQPELLNYLKSSFIQSFAKRDPITFANHLNRSFQQDSLRNLFAQNPGISLFFTFINLHALLITEYEENLKKGDIEAINKTTAEVTAWRAVCQLIATKRVACTKDDINIYWARYLSQNAGEYTKVSFIVDKIKAFFSNYAFFSHEENKPMPDLFLFTVYQFFSKYISCRNNQPNVSTAEKTVIFLHQELEAIIKILPAQLITISRLTDALTMIAQHDKSNPTIGLLKKLWNTLTPLVNKIAPKIYEVGTEITITDISPYYESKPPAAIWSEILYIKYLMDLMRLEIAKQPTIATMIVNFYLNDFFVRGFSSLASEAENYCKTLLVTNAKHQENFPIKKLVDSTSDSLWTWSHVPVWFTDIAILSVLLPTFSAADRRNLFPSTTPSAFSVTWNSLFYTNASNNIVYDICQLAVDRVQFIQLCEPENKQAEQAAVANLLVLSFVEGQNHLDCNFNSKGEQSWALKLMITDWWNLLQKLQKFTGQTPAEQRNLIVTIRDHIYLAQSSLQFAGQFVRTNDFLQTLSRIHEYSRMHPNALIFAFQQYYKSFVQSNLLKDSDPILAQMLAGENEPYPLILEENLSIKIAYTDFDDFEKFLETPSCTTNDGFDNMVELSRSNTYPLLHLLLKRSSDSNQNFLATALPKISAHTIQASIMAPDGNGDTFLDLLVGQNNPEPLIVNNQAIIALLSQLQPCSLTNILLGTRSSAGFFTNAPVTSILDKVDNKADELFLKFMLAYAKLLDECGVALNCAADQSPAVGVFGDFLNEIFSPPSSGHDNRRSSPATYSDKDFFPEDIILSDAPISTDAEDQDPNSLANLKSYIVDELNKLHDTNPDEHEKVLKAFNTYLDNRYSQCASSNSNNGPEAKILSKIKGGNGSSVETNASQAVNSCS